MKSRELRIIRRLAAVPVCGLAVLAASCGDVARTGKSPAFLVIESLEGASGAEGSGAAFAGVLNSDVETIVETTVAGQTVRTPTVFNDSGRATFRLSLKDIGTVASPTTPSALNDITITRYRVVFVRADGRNTPGVDVPHAFDGAFTLTVSGNSSSTGTFDLVRHQSKREPPLSNMRGGGGARLLSTIAEIMFFGRDQAGHEVAVSGSISVNFADFGDPR